VISVRQTCRRLEKYVETTKTLISSFLVVRRTTKIDEPSILVGFPLCYESGEQQKKAFMSFLLLIQGF